ncbi:MAG: hypothetical protein ACE5DL_04835, partial [Nitrosopumilaceae archaeon]
MDFHAIFKKTLLILFSLCVLTVSIESVFAIDITQTDLISHRAQIHSEGEKIFLVWTERSENNTETFFSKSIDEGVTFSKPMNLSDNPGDSAFPRMAINGNDVFVTWYDYSQGQSEVMFAKSLDLGDTFTSYNISDNISASYNPWIAAYSDFVYLVWNDGGKSQELEIGGKTKIVDVLVGDTDIMLGVSDDKGQNFEIKNISNMTGDSINSRMRISDNSVYLTWKQGLPNSDIFFSKSIDSPFSFSTPINVSNSNSPSSNSGIQVYDEDIYLIWEEKNENSREIYFSKSEDKGNSFQFPISLSGNLGNYKITRDTQIGISYPHLYVVYNGGINSGIYLAHSPNMGDTFYDPINLSANSISSGFAQILTKENNINVIWREKVDGYKNVFLRESFDYGHTFGPKINLSDNFMEAELSVLGPQISLSDNFLNIVLENQKNSTSNLFLKQKPLNSSLSFLVSDIENQIFFEENEIQPGKETAIKIKFLNWEKSILMNYKIHLELLYIY